ncbi:MAG: 2-oxoacid:acceptor oxidoreductase subunit alpha [Armatimonadetes bacterium]|nr:2-oxoacid:acceptor oxidoreductase subunit alpha [Armatimonadota bacterium]
MAVDLTIRVAGENGEGLLSVGVVASQAFARMGLNVYSFNTPPAEIKGGPSMVQLRVSDHPVHSQGDALDLLMAWNQENHDRHIGSLKSGGLLLYDPGECRPPERSDVTAVAVPLNQIIREQIRNPRPKNVLAFAVLASLIGVPRGFAETFVRQKFQKRADLLPLNLTAVERGYQFAQECIPAAGKLAPLAPQDAAPRVILTGNQAVALGAMAAGLQFFAGYPITPASEIMEFLSQHLAACGGVVVQSEDEISSLAAVIGASFAGRKAATATSGPGLALMVELLGLATMQELPAVIINVQRGGPSTGLPTRTEQGDLDLAVYGRHGDAPRIVLAPTNVEECFYDTMHAFNLAEKYQTPVILLSDQHLAQRSEAVPRPDPARVPLVRRRTVAEGTTDFRRYALTADGISPVAVPGEHDTPFVGTGLEHDERAHIDYSAHTHEVMMRKRQNKIGNAENERGFVVRSGPARAELGLICWGGTTGPVREALAAAEQQGLSVALLVPKMLWPLPERAISEFMASVDKTVVVEMNLSGQLANLIQSRLCRPVQRLGKYSGMPFTATEILSFIEGAVGHHG